jgi:hypothetical protein
VIQTGLAAEPLYRFELVERGQGMACGDAVQVGRDDSAVNKASPAGKPALGVWTRLAAGG